MALQRDAGSPGDGSQMAVLLIARPVIVAPIRKGVSYEVESPIAYF